MSFRLTDGIGSTEGASGMFRRRRDFDHDVSQPYTTWKCSACRTRLWRNGSEVAKTVAKTVESSMTSTIVMGHTNGQGDCEGANDDPGGSRWSRLRGVCGQGRSANDDRD
jgi:hypothetical protein